MEWQCKDGAPFMGRYEANTRSMALNPRLPRHMGGLEFYRGRQQSGHDGSAGPHVNLMENVTMVDAINEACAIEEHGHVSNVNTIQLGYLGNLGSNMRYSDGMRMSKPSGLRFVTPRARVVYKSTLDGDTKNLIAGYLTGPSAYISDISGFEDDSYVSSDVTTPTE